ncbi:MFS transporter [Komagataeibacter sp. AV436]|uniref:MFS transporter n=2 Tax=Komagataeibacter melomenusus TaxID=2766578 RepID=A0ABX2AH30_9PROT|nr:MFS transporter [Komagataeibacter melomenusus]MBV1829023.1 MFS transporter [Komagataeibacter melomenusus]NPC67115.1 MFS transporter [Komagataeibacter melomenusus]
MPFNIKNPVSKWWVFALLYVAWCLSFLDRSAMNMAAPVIVGDLHISPARQGMILGIFYLGYAFMQIPGGWMADRYGPKWIVITGLVAWSAFTMMTGLTWSFLSLIGVRVLFGLGEGIFPGASVKSIYQYFVPKERGSTTAFLMSSNFVGSMIAPFVIIPLIYYMGWRAVFVVMSGVGMLLAGVYALSVPRQAGGPDNVPTIPVNWHTIAILLKLRETWRLVGIFFCISLVNKGLDTWMPSYLLRECGISLKSAGFLLSAPYLSAGIATALGGWVLMRYFHDRERMFMNVNIVLLCLALGGMYCASTVNEVIFCEVLVYFFKSLAFSAIMFLPSRTLPPVFIGLGISIINFGGQVAGFVSAPLIGLILGVTKSYSIVFLCLVGAAAWAMVINMACGRVALYQPGNEER